MLRTRACRTPGDRRHRNCIGADGEERPGIADLGPIRQVADVDTPVRCLHDLVRRVRSEARASRWAGPSPWRASASRSATGRPAFQPPPPPSGGSAVVLRIERYQMPIPRPAAIATRAPTRGQRLRSRRALRRTGRSGVSVKPVLLSDASMLAAVPSLPTSPYCPTRPRKLSLPAVRNRSLTVR